MNLESALKRIHELEEENARLKEELNEYKNRKMSGRKKHDEKWMASFWDWAVLYESGMTIMEIVEKSEISRRTCYRYKAYYEELKKEGKYNFDKQTC